MEISQEDKDKSIEFKNQGNKAYKEKNYQKAIYLYKLAIKKDPNNEIFYLNLASCYIQVQNFVKAMELADKSLKIKETFKGYFRKNQCAKMKGNFEVMKKTLKKMRIFIYSLADSNKTKEKSLEIAINEEKLLKELEADLKEGISKMGSNRSANNFNNLIKNCYYNFKFHELFVENSIIQKNFEEGLKHLTKIWEDFDNKSMLFYLKGKLQYYKGDESDALKNLKLSLTLDSENKGGQEFIDKIKLIEQKKTEGNKLFKNGKCKEAYNKYEEAIQIDPNNTILNSQLYCNKCACQMKLGDWKMAKRDANKAIQMNDKYKKAYLRRGDCNMRLEKYEAAVQDYSSAQRIEDTHDVQKRLSQAQQLYSKNKRKDYYKILGLKKGETDTNLIRKAYKKKALKLHPDRFKDEDERKEAEEEFKDVNQAYAILSDDEKRRRYDMGLEEGEGMGGFPGGMDFTNIFDMFGGGGGSSGMGGFPGGFSFSSGGMGGRRSRSRRGGMGGMGGMGGQGVQCEQM